MITHPLSTSRPHVVSDRVRSAFSSGSAIRKMFEEGQKLKKIHGPEMVADLSLGNPQFSPPELFTRTLREVANTRAEHAYMVNSGYSYVRERVARHLKDRGFFQNIEAQHIVMTVGAAGALNVVLKTILDPGDEVIVPLPYFVEYRFYIDTHQGRMVLVASNDDFSLNVDHIAAAINGRTRAIILNSPNNPTGRIYSRQCLQQLSILLSEKSKEYGRTIFLLSDEPYREIIFDQNTYVSPASLYTNSFMCYSWSKAFSIAGERIGYIAVNPQLETDDWPLLMGSLSMCNRLLGFVNAPAFMQHVIGASIDAEIDVTHYARKRARLCAALDAGGYAYAKPEGSFYIFPRTPEPESDFIERAKKNLLLVVPGKAFGQEGFFRLSFAVSDKTVDLACEKLITLPKKNL